MLRFGRKLGQGGDQLAVTRQGQESAMCVHVSACNISHTFHK